MNIGILGFAHGHVGMYCTRWTEHPEMNIRIVAGWDHDLARAEANCRHFQTEMLPEASAILDRRDIHGVVIASETSMHADLVEQAAEAGKAIVLQKPISLTIEEANRIVDAVNRNRVPFTLAWQMRVDPHNLHARALLRSGEFGKVFQARRRHCLSTQYMKDFEKSWHVAPELNRDIFADDAAHPIDFMYWMFGMPETVYAEMGTLLNPMVRNDNAIALFRYSDGMMAEVSCSFVAVAGENTLEILCEHGLIIGNYGDGPSNAVRPPGAPQLKWWHEKDRTWHTSDVEIGGQGERIANLALPLAEFLNGRRSPIATAEEGRDVLRLVLACYESAESGRRINL